MGCCRHTLLLHLQPPSSFDACCTQPSCTPAGRGFGRFKGAARRRWERLACPRKACPRIVRLSPSSRLYFTLPVSLVANLTLPKLQGHCYWFRPSGLLTGIPLTNCWPVVSYHVRARGLDPEPAPDPMPATIHTYSQLAHHSPEGAPCWMVGMAWQKPVRSHATMLRGGCW